MKEEWRDIKGYEGKYQISNLGRVKSLNYKHTKKEKILSNVPDTEGYLLVSLYKSGKKKPFRIHKLVAIHFIPNPNNLPEINHKDEDKTNNGVSNLEWCSIEYNLNYGTRNKRISEKLKGREFTEEHKKKISEKMKDSKNPKARKVQCITTGRKFGCIKEAGEYYKLTSSQIKHISDCCRGKRKYCGKDPITGEKLT